MHFRITLTQLYLHIMFDQNWMKNVRGVSFKFIWADTKTCICLFWTLTPKRAILILPELQTEHNLDEACQKDAKYQISLFRLNIWRRSSVLKFYLIYPIKCPSWEPEHISKAHSLNDHIYQVWSNRMQTWGGGVSLVKS